MMSGHRWPARLFLVAGICLGTLVGPTVPAASAGRMACADLVRQVDRLRWRTPTSSKVDIMVVAHELGEEPAWVERCMRVHGRRFSNPAPIHHEWKEELEERWEEAEPEELGPEELREAREAGVTPERQPKLRPEPTSPAPR